MQAAILRHLLYNKEPPPAALWDAFLQNTTFQDFSLNSHEKCRVYSRLPLFLLPRVGAESAATAERLSQFFNVLHGYGISIESETYAHGIAAIAALYKRDPAAGRPLLRHLFNAREARRHPLEENFRVIQTEASYLNVLRQDAKLLFDGCEFMALFERPDLKLCYKGFLRKLAVYFSEKKGLADRYLLLLRRMADLKTHVWLRNAITRLTREGEALRPPANLENDPYEPVPKKPRLSRLLKDDIDFVSVANWILLCSPASLQHYLGRLVVEPRLARLVLALRAPRTGGLLAATHPAALPAPPPPPYVPCAATHN